MLLAVSLIDLGGYTILTPDAILGLLHDLNKEKNDRSLFSLGSPPGVGCTALLNKSCDG